MSLESMKEIEVRVNGESTSCLEGIKLPALLDLLQLNPRLIALEYNGEILHRQYWETQEIQQGDRLEIVTIVGGG